MEIWPRFSVDPGSISTGLSRKVLWPLASHAKRHDRDIQYSIRLEEHGRSLHGRSPVPLCHSHLAQ